MKRYYIMFLLIAATLLPLAAREQNTKQRQIEMAVNNMIIELMELEETYIDELDFNERREAISKINSIMERLDIILRLNGISPSHTKPTPMAVPTPTPEPTPAPIYNYKPEPLTKEQFSHIMNVLKETIKKDDQLNYLKALTRDTTISTVQAKMFIELFHSNKDIVAVFRIIYPSIHDKGGIPAMIESFKYYTTRKALQEEYFRLQLKP